MKRVIWIVNGEERSSFDFDRPLSLVAHGNGRIVPGVEQATDSVTVLPVEPLRQVVGVALVPGQATDQVVCNGLPLVPGLHELRHADRLDVRHQTFWISTEFSAEETEYDPSAHPPEAFCFLTKARLAQGDPIAICPGTPDTPCGMIYKQAAWVMAQQSGAAFGCPNCGFSPARAAWAPPVQRRAESLDQLLELVVPRSQQKP
jgi:hypothetical protein